MKNSSIATLELAGITKSFGKNKVLVGVRLEVFPGEILAIVGKNGSGKSTLIKIISGYIGDYEGEVFLEGKSSDFGSPGDASKEGVAVLHQDLCVFPNMSIAENLVIGSSRYPKRFGFISFRSLRNGAQLLLNEYSKGYNPNQEIGELDSVHQRIIAIAKVLQSSNVKLLILDEPTESLSEGDVAFFHSVIEKLAETGVAVVYVSHKLKEIRSLAHRVIVLRDGKKVLDNRQDCLSMTEIIEAITGVAETIETADNVSQKSITVGNPETEKENLPVISISNLSASRIHDLSLEVYPGEIIGVAGLTGSGRSSLLKVLSGLIREYSGEITMFGKHCKFRSSHDAYRHGVWYLPQSRSSSMFPAHLIWEDITISVARLFKSRLRLTDRRSAIDLASNEIGRFQIVAESPRMKTIDLSGGNQQKVVLARGLQNKPKIVLLDEPITGVDITSAARIKEEIRQLANSGVAIMVVMSDLSELLSLVDRLLILKEGRLVADTDASLVSEIEVTKYFF
jgi:ABC-type sugar transport system ATPase subunit